MSKRLADYTNIIAGFSSVADGTMAVDGGFANRERYLLLHGLSPDRTVHAGLCHGTTSSVVNAAQGGTVIANTDGLMTNETNVGLAMTAADCLLLSVYDPVQGVIGLVHAGSKGLSKNVVSVFLQTWLGSFSSEAKNLIVDISPSICAVHYTITLQQAQAFSEWPKACRRNGDAVQLDLRFIATEQLLAVGVASPNITTSMSCTFEDATLFSYRRDHPVTPQLQVGYLMRRV